MAIKTSMIRARIQPNIKKSAEEIIEKLGLKPTDVITMLYIQIIDKKQIPFSISLEKDDKPEHYIKVNDNKELRSLIGLENV
jgi:DNA-damage-inducible protein J